MREEQFEQLYAEHADALFAFLSYRTGDRVLAEDMLADTFERALRARRRSAEGRALERMTSGPGPGSPDTLESLADRDLLSRGLAALSEEERDAIALRFGADLTVPEIAKLTGERLTTVEGRVYRALRKLREAMD